MATSANAAAELAESRTNLDSQAAAAHHDTTGDALAKEPLLREQKSSCDAASVNSSDVSVVTLVSRVCNLKLVLPSSRSFMSYTEIDPVDLHLQAAASLFWSMPCTTDRSEQLSLSHPLVII